MEEHDWDRPYVAQEKMALFDAIHRHTARMYGGRVRAAELSNVDYKMRFEKLASAQAMKDPPRCARIFAGYVVVRRLGTPEQYETWLPGDVFEELYRSGK